MTLKKKLTAAALIIALLAIIDGLFTYYGLKTGLYIGEYNFMIASGIDIVGKVETFAIRTLFIISWLVATLYIFEVYENKKLTVIPIAITMTIYIGINIYHVINHWRL